jgi:hypothetical protein
MPRTIEAIKTEIEANYATGGGASRTLDANGRTIRVHYYKPNSWTMQRRRLGWRFRWRLDGKVVAESVIRDVLCGAA